MTPRRIATERLLDVKSTGGKSTAKEANFGQMVASPRAVCDTPQQ